MSEETSLEQEQRQEGRLERISDTIQRVLRFKHEDRENQNSSSAETPIVDNPPLYQQIAREYNEATRLSAEESLRNGYIGVAIPNRSRIDIGPGRSVDVVDNRYVITETSNTGGGGEEERGLI